MLINNWSSCYHSQRIEYDLENTFFFGVQRGVDPARGCWRKLGLLLVD